MSNELGGQPGIAGQHYHAARILSAWRDRLGLALDRLRP